MGVGGLKAVDPGKSRVCQHVHALTQTSQA